MNFFGHNTVNLAGSQQLNQNMQQAPRMQHFGQQMPQTTPNMQHFGQNMQQSAYNRQPAAQYMYQNPNLNQFARLHGSNQFTRPMQFVQPQMRTFPSHMQPPPHSFGHVAYNLGNVNYNSSLFNCQVAPGPLNFASVPYHGSLNGMKPSFQSLNQTQVRGVHPGLEVRKGQEQHAQSNGPAVVVDLTLDEPTDSTSGEVVNSTSDGLVDSSDNGNGSDAVILTKTIHYRDYIALSHEHTQSGSTSPKMKRSIKEAHARAKEAGKTHTYYFTELQQEFGDAPQDRNPRAPPRVFVPVPAPATSNTSQKRKRVKMTGDEPEPESKKSKSEKVVNPQPPPQFQAPVVSPPPSEIECEIEPVASTTVLSPEEDFEEMCASLEDSLDGDIELEPVNFQQEITLDTFIDVSCDILQSAFANLPEIQIDIDFFNTNLDTLEPSTALPPVPQPASPLPELQIDDDVLFAYIDFDQATSAPVPAHVPASLPATQPAPQEAMQKEDNDDDLFEGDVDGFDISDDFYNKEVAPVRPPASLPATRIVDSNNNNDDDDDDLFEGSVDGFDISDDLLNKEVTPAPQPANQTDISNNDDLFEGEVEGFDVSDDLVNGGFAELLEDTQPSRSPSPLLLTENP